MLEDAQLLRQFVDDRSEAAFSELVRRHLDLVYHAAARQLGDDAHLAADVAQAVFVLLVEKAPRLRGHPSIAGWLHTTTHFKVADVLRAERRRKRREEEAHTMDILNSEPAADAEWQRMRPLIDAALLELKPDDREAVLLRFFENRPFAEIGARLRLNEKAAHMRVERALDKLHTALARQGISSSGAALGAVLAGQAASAAPAGLAAAVTGTALAHTVAATAGGWLIFMGVTKTQIGVAAALALIGMTGVVIQARGSAAMEREVTALQAERSSVMALRIENRQLASALAEVEMLRRDDAVLAQLGRDVEQAKRAQAARSTQTSTVANQAAWAQGEVDRMNREGNKLVEEYKNLVEKRATAEAAQKLAEINAKQLEVQAFMDQHGMSNPAVRMALHPPSGSVVPGTYGYSSSGRGPVEGNVDQASLALPNADLTMALRTYESIAGTKVVIDPALAQMTNRVNLDRISGTRAEIAQRLREVLQQQGVVLEAAADGSLIAKPAAR